MRPDLKTDTFYYKLDTHKLGGNDYSGEFYVYIYNIGNEEINVIAVGKTGKAKFRPIKTVYRGMAGYDEKKYIPKEVRKIFIKAAFLSERNF
jgi:flavin-dependent dehydrogenase